jgi:hypothetical protein
LGTYYYNEFWIPKTDLKREYFVNVETLCQLVASGQVRTRDEYDSRYNNRFTVFAVNDINKFFKKRPVKLNKADFEKKPTFTWSVGNWE